MMTRSGFRPVVLAGIVAAVLGVAGCAAGEEGSFSPDSLTCQAAHSLFDEGAGEGDAATIGRLAAGVPADLRGAVERLAHFPVSVDEWQDYDADLARVQQWAVTACGATVAFPAETDDTVPRLEDHLTSVSRDGEMLSVTVSGATGLDAAVVLCEQALAEYAEPGHSVALEVRDSFGIMLAFLDGGGRCALNSEFAG